MAKTPKRAGRRPSRPGAGFPEDVLAANCRSLRALRRLTQGAVAERMHDLGHETWSRATLTQVEAAARSVSVGELFALALALEASPAALLDVTRSGVRQLEIGPLSLGPQEFAPWLTGEAQDRTVQWVGPHGVAFVLAQEEGAEQ